MLNAPDKKKTLEPSNIIHYSKFSGATFLLHKLPPSFFCNITAMECQPKKEVVKLSSTFPFSFFSENIDVVVCCCLSCHSSFIINILFFLLTERKHQKANHTRNQAAGYYGQKKSNIHSLHLSRQPFSPKNIPFIFFSYLLCFLYIPGIYIFWRNVAKSKSFEKLFL